jgi:tRNA A37 threonylcarbamoyladenosine biosynthesis protein TsaE
MLLVVLALQVQRRITAPTYALFKRFLPTAYCFVNIDVTNTVLISM